METNTPTAAAHKCPYCNSNELETVATTPYVRGFLIAYQIGYKSYIGCVPCVKKKVFGEAGLSSLIGWFSISSLIVNPFLIVYNLGQGALLGPKAEKVRKKLNELGISETPGEFDIVSVSYALATAMIAADGKIEDAEVAAAEKLGASLFDTFENGEFRKILENHKELPSINDLASLLKDSLDTDGKKHIYRYLEAIAKSDGDFAQEEKEMLEKVATIMEFTPEG